MKQIFALAVLVMTLAAPSLAEAGCGSGGCGRTRCHRPGHRIVKLVAKPFHRCCR